MPELLRAWGETLRESSEGGHSVVLIAFGLMGALLCLFVVGALVQAASRALPVRRSAPGWRSRHRRQR
jgi:trimethylamine:corrinoid methyltransferase-like protein